MPYDPDRVHGHVLALPLDPADALAAGLRAARRSGSRSPACTPTGRRRSSPASSSWSRRCAPSTSSEITVSEHDILYGAAIRVSRFELLVESSVTVESNSPYRMDTGCTGRQDKWVSCVGLNPDKLAYNGYLIYW